MKLSDLPRLDGRSKQEVVILGSGPTAPLIDPRFFRNKTTITLNDSFKIYQGVGDYALVHHEGYLFDETGRYHHNLKYVKYPIIKNSGSDNVARFYQTDPCFFVYEWSHDLDRALMTDLKATCLSENKLFYRKDGCSLHAALQIALLIGAHDIFLVGCDSREFGGYHYGAYGKDGFRDDDGTTKPPSRHYDAYIDGALLLKKYFSNFYVNIFSITPFVGLTDLDRQYNDITV